MKNEEKDGVEKHFAEKGNLLREQIWLAGVAKGERLYYLNGKPKMEKVPGKDPRVLLVRQFYDDGTVRSSGSYLAPEGSDASSLLVGDPSSRLAEGLFSHYTESGRLYLEETFETGQLLKSRAYHRNGKLGVEELYEANRLTSRRCYDPAGNLLGSEKYFEDGSREPSNKPCPKGDGELPSKVPVNGVWRRLSPPISHKCLRALRGSSDMINPDRFERRGGGNHNENSNSAGGTDWRRPHF